MRLAVVVVVFISLTFASPDYDDFTQEKIILDSTDIIKQQHNIRDILFHSMQCSKPSTNWKCKAGCYDSFNNLTAPLPDKCGLPSPSDTCFGQAFDFAYLHNTNRFPEEYQVLQNFPRCWSHLAPLICATHYRPCAKHEVSFGNSHNGSKIAVKSLVEMHAKINRGYCRETLRLCSDVIQAGYYPDFIGCNLSNEINNSSTSLQSTIGDTNTSDIFTDTCQIPKLPVPFKFQKKCPFPLVYIEGKIKGSRPVMDLCYITCRSGHFDEKSRFYQNTHQIVFGTILTIMFTGGWVHLHFFSISQMKSIVVFCASQAFLTIAIWTFSWALGPILYQETDCIEMNGFLIRKTEITTEFLHWCVTQSILMSFSLNAAFQWLAAVSYFGLVCPGWVNAYEKTQKGWNIRSILLYSINIISAIVALFWQSLHLHESDGISGICLSGLLSFSHYVPIIFLPALSTFWMIYSIYRFYYLYHSYHNKAFSSAKRYVKFCHEYQTDRRKRFFKWKGVENVTDNDYQNIDEDELEDAEDNGQVSIHEEPVKERLKLEKAKSDGDTGGFVYRMIRRHNCDRIRESLKEELEPTLSEKVLDNLIDDGIQQYVSVFIDEYSKHRINFHYGFGLSWLLVMSIVAFMCIWASLPLHYLLINTDPSYEVDSIKNYINCALHRSIVEKYTEWIHYGQREDAFSECELNPYLSKQRPSYIILVFILIPTAPFMVLMTSMIAGVCGRGGMKTISQVKWRREYSNPEKEKIPLNEIELEEGEKRTLDETTNSETEEIDEDTNVLSPAQTTSNRTEPQGRQPGPSAEQNGSLATHREENRVQSAVASSCPLSAVQRNDSPRRNEPDTAENNKLANQRPPPAKEGPSNEEQNFGEIANRLQGFVRKLESAGQGMLPLPPVQDVQVLIDDLRAAGRRERTLTQHHQIAMEAMRDLSAFINYNAERLRADIEMWNLITTTLNQLSSVTNELFPYQETNDGHQARRVDPEHARLYEVLLGITQMLTTVNPHLMEFENWREVSNQASHRLRTSVNTIVRGVVPRSVVTPQNTAPSRPIIPSPQAPRAPAQEYNAASINGERKNYQTAQKKKETKQAVPSRGSNSSVDIDRPSTSSQSNRPAAMVPRVGSPNRATRQNNQGSAYMETYSAAPNGFITRFTDQELSIRISRMAEIHGSRSYPQEFIYALVMTGDIRLAGNDNPVEGERIIMPSDYPRLFGRAVPIDVVTPPREFLLAMRRRAIIFVMTLGYDYNRRGRNVDNNNYMPPTFPDLGMTSMNELLLVRIFGTENLVRMKSLLQQLLAQQFVRYSPEIPEVGAFSAYLDHFATARGFPHQREEWVHDPEHPVEPCLVTIPPRSCSSSPEDNEDVQMPSPSREQQPAEEEADDESNEEQSPDGL